MPPETSAAPDPDGDLPDRVAEGHDRDALDAEQESRVTAADWSIPDWTRHPRLEGILGARLADITWDHLDALVVRKVSEDISIDFKKCHYVLDRNLGRTVLPSADNEAMDSRIAKDRFELAKDVTAFANSAGGLIVIGVSDSNGRAERFTNVDLKDSQRLTYLDTLRNWTAPFLPGIEVGYVASALDSDRGCVLIYVSPSAERPHAVVEPNSHRHTWYVRDGAHAVPLSEAQVAVAYRDRYAGRGAIDQHLSAIFDQGVQGLNRQHRVWLAVAAVPSQSAQRRHLDRHLLDEFKQQTLIRQADLPGAPLGDHAAFGRGRVVLRDSSANGILAKDHLLNLYIDGSAFAAVALDTLEDPQAVLKHRPDLEYDVQCIRVGSITTWSLALTGITCGHAVDAGASGALEVLCGVVTATEDDPDIFSTNKDLPVLDHVVLDQPWRSGSNENPVPGTTGRKVLEPVRTTVSAAVSSDTRELITVGAQLVSEIVAEFGNLPSDPLLTPSGFVVGEHCYGSRLEPLREWARCRGLLAEDQALAN